MQIMQRLIGVAQPIFARREMHQPAIRQQAQAYCPATAAKYAKVNPATVTRPVAQQMGNACLSEMGPFKATFARGTVQSAIDQAFPK